MQGRVHACTHVHIPENFKKERKKREGVKGRGEKRMGEERGRKEKEEELQLQTVVSSELWVPGTEP